MVDKEEEEDLFV